MVRTWGAGLNRPRGGLLMKSSNEKMIGESKNAPASAAEPTQATLAQWDHSTHDTFYDYYAKESQTEKAQQRFRGVRDAILRVMVNGERAHRILDVADIGCGAGTQSMIWAELGHAVHAVDVNEPLVDLGRERAAKAGFAIDFCVGSATALPWSMPRKLCGCRAAPIASIATCRLPSVLFFKPTGIERPLAISRCVCDSVVRAPIAAHEIKSAMYCGTMGSRNSVAAGKPMPVICSNSRRAIFKPVSMSCEPSRCGSLINPFQPTIVRGFSKYTRIMISMRPANFSRSPLSRAP